MPVLAWTVRRHKITVHLKPIQICDQSTLRLDLDAITCIIESLRVTLFFLKDLLMENGLMDFSDAFDNIHTYFFFFNIATSA